MLAHTGIPKTLTIAGSDSGGGAGIQADLKTFQTLGCYGMSVVTAVTAQNTVAVKAIHEVPADVVAQQISAVLEDIGADAVKTGMLASADIVEVVAESLRRFGVQELVVDPVMISKSGAALLEPHAIDALKRHLFPLALLVCPNIPEAEQLSGVAIRDGRDVERAAEVILALGPQYVLIKGGHLPGDVCTDRLFGAVGLGAYSAARVATRNTHGTGCTYSAAITAYLAKGHTLEEAVGRAKGWLQRALETAPDIGSGHGPLNHRAGEER